VSRLRPLSESECYARLYGARDSTVDVIREAAGERGEPGPLEAELRRAVEERYGLRPPEAEAA
jgi:hypothetical protein